MIINEVDQKIVDTTNKPRLRYTISEENMAKMIQQAICAYEHPVEARSASTPSTPATP